MSLSTVTVSANPKRKLIFEADAGKPITDLEGGSLSHEVYFSELVQRRTKRIARRNNVSYTVLFN